MTPRSTGTPSFDPDKLAELRKQQGWSQVTLAQRTGVSQHVLSRWETGQQTPTPANLVELAAALSVPPHVLTDVVPAQAGLRDLRLWAGFSITQLANELGISHTSVIRYETGKHTVPDEILQQLADLFEVSMQELSEAAGRARTGR